MSKAELNCRDGCVMAAVTATIVALALGCGAPPLEDHRSGPTASIGPRVREVLVDEEVVFEVVSHGELLDPDSPLTRWYVRQRPSGGTEEIVQTHPLRATFVPGLAGDFLICFEGAHVSGGAIEACAWVVASWPADVPRPTVLVEGPHERTVRLGDEIRLTMSAQPGMDGYPAELIVRSGDNVHLQRAEGDDWIITGRAAGTAAITVFARDARGLESDPVALTIEVTERWPFVDIPAIALATWSRDLDRMIVLLADRRTVAVFDTTTAEVERSLRMPGEVSSLSTSPAGLLAVAAGDGALHVASLDEGVVRSLEAEGTVAEATIADDGTVYYAVYGEREIVRTLRADGSRRASDSGHYPLVATRLRVSPYGDRLIALYPSGTTSGMVLYELDERGATRLASQEGRGIGCGEVWFSPSGATVFTRCGWRYRLGPASLTPIAGGRYATRWAVPDEDDAWVLYVGGHYSNGPRPGDVVYSDPRDSFGRPPHHRVAALHGAPADTRFLFREASGVLVVVARDETGTRWGLSRIPADDFVSDIR